MVTIPAEIVKILKIKGGERVKVLFDQEEKKIIYQII